MMPVIAGLVGYGTNWVGIKLMFQPTEFRGIRVDAARPWTRLLPRKLRSLPGVADAGIGWQGIIPSRASKIGSLAFDTGIGRIADPTEFFRELEPDQLALELLEGSGAEIRAITERLAEERYPLVWESLPTAGRELVHARVAAEAPRIVSGLAADVEANLEQIFDPKLMIIRRMSTEPELASKLSKAVGEKDLVVVIRLGLVFGALFGVVQAFLYGWLEAWWLLPVGGVIVGSVTNYLALKLLFHPMEPRRIGPITIQGSYMKRQPQVAAGYAQLVAEDLMGPEQVAHELLTGPNSDRAVALLDCRLGNRDRPAAGPRSGDRQTGRL